MSDDQEPIKIRKISVNQPTMSGLQNVSKGKIGLKGIILDGIEKIGSE